MSESRDGVLLCPLRCELREIPVETAGIRACWIAISHIRATSWPTPLTWNQSNKLSEIKFQLFCVHSRGSEQAFVSTRHETDAAE